MKIYDITATIGDDLPIYSGDRPYAEKLMRLENGDICNFSKLVGTTHTGTHADMPMHFTKGGVTCESVSLDHFYGRAKLVRIFQASHITKQDLVPHGIEEGIILLIDTGYSKYMRQAALVTDFIALTPCAAQYLIEKKVKTIGIDYMSVDPYDSTDYPVHTALLGNGIPILEGLVLDDVPEGEYTLSALPLKIHDGDGSPVRAVLVNA